MVSSACSPLLFILAVLCTHLCQSFLPQPLHARCARRSLALPSSLLSSSERVLVEGPEEIAVGDTLKVLYKPGGLLNPRGSLAFYGGFNGWNGEDQPALAFPMISQPDGAFAASVTVPAFAKSIDFIISDGNRFDTNDGELYHLLVRHVQEVDAEGRVHFFLQEQDGTLIPQGFIEPNDPQELERMIQEEMAQRGRFEEQVPTSEPEAHVEREEEQEREPEVIVVTRNEIANFSAEDELQMHMERSEAGLLAERLGIGRSILAGIMESFDAYATKGEAYLPKSRLRAAMERLGFELDETTWEELVRLHVGDGDAVDMKQFLRIYSDLDQDDVGITIL